MRAPLALRLRRSGVDDSPLQTAAGYAMALLYALIILIPLYFVFVSSFKPNAEIFGAPLGLPAALDLTKYRQALEQANLLHALFTSTLIAVCAEVLTLLLAFPAAYAIARIRVPWGVWLESFFSLGFLIPALAILMPVFLTAIRLGLLYNPLMLIIFYPATKLSLSILLLSSFLRKIPAELEESAEMDGATHLQKLYHIFLPLARPGVVTVVVLNFIDIWNEYLFALVLLNVDFRTVQIAIAGLKSERLVDYGLVAAGVMISMIPVFIMFLFFQEKIMSGMLAGALKE